MMRCGVVSLVFLLDALVCLTSCDLHVCTLFAYYSPYKAYTSFISAPERLLQRERQEDVGPGRKIGHIGEAVELVVPSWDRCVEIIREKGSEPSSTGGKMATADNRAGI